MFHAASIMSDLADTYWVGWRNLPADWLNEYAGLLNTGTSDSGQTLIAHVELKGRK